jgi:arylsulfatase A-like enzyme
MLMSATRIRSLMTRVCLLPAFTLVQGAAVVTGASAHGAAERPPNIVLIFTDDQGYQDVGCFGSPHIKTPHLDRMAAEGMKFTDFYVAAPVCSASRAALMTGSYPLRVGITGVLFPRHRIGLNPEEFTIGDALKTRGYATAVIGKWHLGHLPEFLPTNNGFDSYFGIPYSNDMDGVKGRNRNLDHAWSKRVFDAWNVPLMENESVLERPADQTTLTRRYTERAVRFIRQNRDRPFFLYLPHTMPHIPLFVAEKFYVSDPHRAYRATIEEIDWSVGEVLGALKEAGVDGRTLVVFTSDNGPWLAKKHHGGQALPLRDGKFSTYEGGMRVPCIMRFPGRIPPGSTCSEIAATIDLLPTFARLAGAELPSGRTIDGRDIWPLMSGQPGARSPHEAYYFYRGADLQAVRSGRWKLRPARGKKRVPELYDLVSDISEAKNVAAEHPDIVERLSRTARQFHEELKRNTRPVGSLKARR